MKLKNRKEGFLLLEVLFTVAILSVGIVLIVQSHIASLRAGIYSDDFFKASFLLRNKMNEVLEQSVVDPDLSEKDSFSPPYENFHYDLKAQEPECEEQCEGLSEVVLTVSWRNGQRTNSASATTYVFNTF
ncbi:MAG: hypothetical protein PHY73_01915 [Candidatus Omnitrophica bacterium]|nr:hypothetical protein [Candidatus Omnitrophota bacterium]